MELNREFSEIWPNILEKRDALPDADEWNGKENKYSEHFSKEAGEGD